jgi:beta-lactamase class A
MNFRAKGLREQVRRIARAVPGTMGVAIRVAGTSAVIEERAAEQYPLASVYKIPLLATLFRQASLGRVDLGRKITLRDVDKSLGSSDLQYFAAGTRLAVADLAYLMIVHSDNTATDMIHRLVGLDSPNRYMRSLGMGSIDVYCPNREYFLLLLGYGSWAKGLDLKDIVQKWRGLSREQRVRILKRTRKETEALSVDEARGRSLRLWGIADEKETAVDRMASEEMDNLGSPSDISRLLGLIATNKVADRKLTKMMIDYMRLCDSRTRLPAKIPEGVPVANKTGTVPGVVNDCAIMMPKRRAPVVCTCLVKGVRHRDVRTVEDRIADIGLAAYRMYCA